MKTISELLATKEANAKIIAEYLLKYSEDNQWKQVEATQQTIESCMNYIRKQARKQASAGMAMIRDDVVFGWAVDFYNKCEHKGNPADGPLYLEKEEKKEEKKEKPKPEVKKDEQMSLFDFL